MRWRTEYPVLLNLLVALAVSLVVNFSYLLLLLVDPNTPAPPPEEVPKNTKRDCCGCRPTVTAI